MSYRAVTERPWQFNVDLSAPILRGACFLGLGQQAGIGRAWDDSGYHCDGTLTGYTGAGNTPDKMWDRVMGRACLKFDGAHDYVMIPGWPSGAAALTVSVWVNMSAVGTRHIFSVNTSGSTVWDTYQPSTGGTIDWYGSGGPTATAAIVNGVWQHHCYVQSYPGTRQVWINGVPGTPQTTTAVTTADTLQVGTWSGLSQFMIGGLADIIVDRRALSAGEIAQRADPAWSVMYGGAIYTRPRRNFVGQVGGSSRRRRLLCGAH